MISKTVFYLLLILFTAFPHCILGSQAACSSTSQSLENIFSQQNFSTQFTRAEELIQLIIVNPNFRKRFALGEELSYLLASSAFFGNNFIDKNLNIHPELKKIILSLTNQEDVDQRFKSALEFYSWFTGENSSLTAQIVQWAFKSLSELSKSFFSSINGSVKMNTTTAEKPSENDRTAEDHDDDDDADISDTDGKKKKGQNKEAKGTDKTAANSSKDTKQNAEKVTFSTAIGTDFKQDIVYPVWSSQDREKTIAALSKVYGELATKASDRADTASNNAWRTNVSEADERRGNGLLGAVRTFNEVFRMPWEHTSNNDDKNKEESKKKDKKTTGSSTATSSLDDREKKEAIDVKQLEEAKKTIEEQKKALDEHEKNAREHVQKIADQENYLDETLRKLSESQEQLTACQEQSDRRLASLVESDAALAKALEELDRYRNGSGRPA